MENEKRKTCAIYTRVSSQGQVEEGWSLDEQKAILIEHAERQGYDIFDVYTDPGISAKDIAHRPQIKRLITDIEESRVDVVCAWKLSRTFRNLNELTTVMEVMKKHNVIFDFKSEGILDLNTTTGKMQAQILGMVAEMERDNIADNVYMGMAAAAKQGKYLAGTPPYGYDLKVVEGVSNKNGGRKLVINQSEADVVRRIFNLFVHGDDDFPSGAGYKHICNVLNHEGILTKQGKEFSIGTIAGIIQNPIYYGVVRWGAHRKWSEQRRKGTTKPILARGDFEPIISEKLFNQAQAIRLSRGGKCPRKYMDTKNILTGILKCPECGAGMVLARATTTNGKKIAYYTCGAWHNKGSSVCHSNSVLLDEVNDIVLGKIANICSDELIVRGVLKNLNKSQGNNVEGSLRDQADLEKALEKTQRDIVSLQRRFESDTYEMDAQEYKRRIKELRSNEETYKSRLADLRVTIGKIQSERSYSIEELRDVFSGIRDVLDHAEINDLRTLMHLMIETITIDPTSRKPDKMVIKFNKTLSDYLCISNEEEAQIRASSFSVINQQELIFTVDLS